MVLYQNSFITLDFDPTTDTLNLDWPGVQKLFVPEVKNEIKIVLGALKQYDIKKLLIDTSKAIVEVGNQDYHDFVMTIVKGLRNTRLQKFARIGTGTIDRENIIEKIIQTSRITLLVDYKVFETKKEAIAWLTL